MKKTRKIPYRLILLIVLIVAVLGSAVSYGYAKYRKDIMLTNEVSGSNRLAEQFQLLQGSAAAQADGSYTFSGDASTSETYYMIPGTTIAQTPMIRIVGKTDLDAYLYLEVIGDLDSRMQYTIASDWTKLEGVTGKHNGSIYVWHNGARMNAESVKSANGTDGSVDLEIPVLEGSFSLDPMPISNSQALSFCGYLLQADNAGAKETFENRFSFK